MDQLWSTSFDSYALEHGQLNGFSTGIYIEKVLIFQEVHESPISIW